MKFPVLPGALHGQTPDSCRAAAPNATFNESSWNIATENVVTEVPEVLAPSRCCHREGTREKERTRARQRRQTLGKPRPSAVRENRFQTLRIHCRNLTSQSVPLPGLSPGPITWGRERIRNPGSKTSVETSRGCGGRPASAPRSAICFGLTGSV